MDSASGVDADTQRSSRPARDSGTSLIEIIIAIAIIGTIMVPVLMAMVGAIRSSSSARSVAETETVVLNAADRINRAPKKCDYSVYVQAAALAQGWPASQATLAQFHYVPGASPSQPGQWVSGACDAPTPGELLVQRVDITVKSPNGRIQRTIQVVKSDV